MTVASVYAVQVLCYFVAILVTVFTSYSVRKDWNEFFHITSVLFILFGGRWIGEVLSGFMISRFGIKFSGKNNVENNYIPIELKGFDEKGLDDFKGKKIISLRFPKKQSPKSGIWYLEIYWEGGQTWKINSNFTDTDTNFDVASIFIEKTMQSLADISSDIKTFELIDFVLKECRIAADYTDERDISDDAIALISENSQELLIVTAPATGAVTFFFYQWFYGDDYPCIGCHLSSLRWRKSNEKIDAGVE